MRACALIGPSTARTAHTRGAAISVISWTWVNVVRAIRRVVTMREPRPGGPSSSRCELATSSCHSANFDGSVTYANTESGGRLISMSCTIGGIRVGSCHIVRTRFVCHDEQHGQDVTDGRIRISD